MGYTENFDHQVALLNEKLSKFDAASAKASTELENSFNTTRFVIARGFTVIASDEELPAGLTILYQKDATLAVKVNAPSSSRYTPLETLEYRARKLKANGLIDVHEEFGRLVGTPVLLGVFDADGLPRAQLVQKIRYSMRFAGNEIEGIKAAAAERRQRKIREARKIYNDGYDDGYLDAWAFYS